ncbi:MAG: serine hydrolase [Oscillospiraceae bacterium]|nr:serine hydrolase [Oscillospiraceae bacterium]
MKKIFIFAITISMALFILNCPAKAAAPFEDIVATSALLAEADTGAILFDHDMTLQHPADALTKIMTLLLAVSAIENQEANPDELIEMTESAWFDIGKNNSTQNISPGESMTLLDLMYCAYIGGADEACNMIAERIDGNVDAFVEHMNTYANNLGCSNTNFVNTHGQYRSEQYTTAQDQFLIFRDAMGKELFAEISGVYRYTTEGTDTSEARSFTNSNSLLNANGKYYYRYCTAGMVSATYEGGDSFVAYAESDGLSLISVVLGSNVIILEDKSAEMRNLTESRRLFEWGFSEFGWRTILSLNDLVVKAPIIHGAGADFVNLRPETEIRLLLDKDIPDEDFVREIVIYSIEEGETLVAPIEAGTVLGELTLTRNGVNHGTVKLVANTSIELHRLEFVKMRISDVLSNKITRTVVASLTVLIVLYIALVVRYNVIRRKRLRMIAEAKRKLKEERQEPN